MDSIAPPLSRYPNHLFSAAALRTEKVISPLQRFRFIRFIILFRTCFSATAPSRSSLPAAAHALRRAGRQPAQHCKRGRCQRGAKGEAPSATDSNKKFGVNRDDSHHAPPFLPDTSFRQGVGKFGKVRNPETPGDEEERTPTPEGPGCATESTQRYCGDEIFNIPRQNSPNPFGILLTKTFPRPSLRSEITAQTQHRPGHNFLSCHLPGKPVGASRLENTKPTTVYIHFHPQKVGTKANKKYHFFPHLRELYLNLKTSRFRLFRTEGASTPLARKRPLIK